MTTKLTDVQEKYQMVLDQLASVSEVLFKVDAQTPAPPMYAVKQLANTLLRLSNSTITVEQAKAYIAAHAKAIKEFEQGWSTDYANLLDPAEIQLDAQETAEKIYFYGTTSRSMDFISELVKALPEQTRNSFVMHVIMKADQLKSSYVKPYRGAVTQLLPNIPLHQRHRMFHMEFIKRFPNSSAGNAELIVFRDVYETLWREANVGKFQEYDSLDDIDHKALLLEWRRLAEANNYPEEVENIDEVLLMFESGLSVVDVRFLVPTLNGKQRTLTEAEILEEFANRYPR